MSSQSETRDSGRFDELAEEFAERYRRGERPSLEEYVDRLPEMADEIREMFPALVEVEQVEGDAARCRPSAAPPAISRLRQVGDFRIVREVGRGGMGVVYEAEQMSLGRRVALKILPGHVAGDRKALERFRREAKAAARLHHTNIVPVFEVGSDGDVAFYAMQFIQGQGLDQVIDELRRLRVPDAQSADGGAAHAGSGGCARPDCTHGPGREHSRRRPAESDARAVGRIAFERPPGDGRAGTISGCRMRGYPHRRDQTARRGRDRGCSGVERQRPDSLRIDRTTECRAQRCCREGRRSQVRRAPLAGRSSAAWRRSAARWHKGWPTRTREASFTVTSSRRTCFWTQQALSGLPTSAWPKPKTTA